MPSSHEKRPGTTASLCQMEPASAQLGSTLYALILGALPPSFDDWMTSEQARAWLLSEAMPPTRRHKMVMQCPVCSTVFTRSPSSLRAQKDACENLTHTCSNKCMGVMRSHMKRAHLRCDECKKPFSISSAEHARRKERGDKHVFCSKECYGVFRSKSFVGEKHHNYSKVEARCTMCKKTFLRQSSRLSMYRTQNPFCSKVCYHEWQRGRVTQKGTGRASPRSYPSEFKVARAKMLSEKARCVVCMYPAKDLHHKDGNIENNDSSNLAPVCRRCHTRHHAGPPHPLLSPSSM